MSAAADLEAFLERIALREAEIRAFAWFDAERARRLAREIDASAAADAPLRGVPVAVKDVIDVAGLPTGMGSPLYAANAPEKSAELVVRLERAGALMLGKAVTAELAYFSPGPTRNPHNLAHTPGGSSSGSAAAVAAGFAPLAIGTQTNGSVIRPAAFCGVVGFKPSRGRISTHGVLSWSPTFDQPGVFAANVGDTRRAFTVLDAEQKAECSILESTSRPEFNIQNSTLRIRAVRSPVWERADVSQRRAFAAALATLRAAGAEIVEEELPARFESAHAAHARIMNRDGALFFRDLLQRHPEQLSREIHRLVDEGSRVSEAEYAEAQALRLGLQRDLDRCLDGFDAIVTPPACGEAPLGLAGTGDPTFCTIWTLCGVPALSLPIARGPHGLPLGLQLVGRFDRDEALLAAAEWCERVQPQPS